MREAELRGETILELRNVGLCYRRDVSLMKPRGREFWALKDVSLKVRRGEALGIIGRNGAGKSSLLRVLAGIISPDRGAYINAGHRATLLSLQVGFDRRLSGRENVMLSGLLLGLAKAEIVARMDEIIAFSELEDFIDQPIQTYSSGMRARLGFATAFYVRPDVLLIDEVLGVGDAAFVEKSKATMRERIRSGTTVLVSHNAAAITELCDRVVWLHRGEVRREGGAAEVMDDYLAGVRSRSS